MIPSYSWISRAPSQAAKINSPIAPSSLPGVCVPSLSSFLPFPPIILRGHCSSRLTCCVWSVRLRGAALHTLHGLLLSPSLALSNLLRCRVCTELRAKIKKKILEHAT
ncbi:hypothetical protein I7I50_05029 [Histoplasma capsulatum G186AR]|uniref:Uncharacterized protein n=1 Tax=Ajellomyces capsulatus TaxID=5037 RepID=A0A8H7ZC01_AJECA|nr:hypothetical protein I7I52_03287 [Histoplasma capsulatum]QSS75773.1 hypothetical protein I7I50_05029 [Histoplasma capsulatum G186AR]